MGNFKSVFVRAISALAVFALFPGCQYLEKMSGAQLAYYQSASVSSAGASFQQVNQSVIQPKCVSCHSSSTAAAGVDLSTYAKVMSTGSVVAFSPGKSTFYTTCASGSMPTSGGALSSDLVAMISSWISAGAKQDSILMLTSVLPATGATTGGTAITLSGDAFASGATVTVGGAGCTSVNVVSPVQLTCTTPAHAVASADVVVKNADGTSVTLASGFKFVALSAAAPSVSSISPVSGPASGGTSVTIQGSGFAAGAVVSIGGITCNGATVVSTSEVTCTTAAHSGAIVDVVVTNSDTQSGKLAAGFTYTLVATYSSIFQNILQPKCLACHSGASAAFGVDYSTYVKTLSTGSVVAGNPSGSTTYSTTAAGTMPTSGGALSAIELKAISDWISAGAKSDTAPTVTQVSPSQGSISGNTTVQLSGTQFMQGIQVSIGGSACSGVTFVSASRLTCMTPPHAAGASDVVVTNPDAQSATLPQGFTFQNPAPVITNVSPVSGTSLGGTLFTVNGTGFISGATVSLGGANCTGLTYVSATQVKCTTSAHAAGAVSVVLTNPDLNSTQLNLGYTYLGAPTVASVAPATGTTAGGTQIAISGTGIQSGASVSLGGVACAGVSVASSTSISCTTSAHPAGAVDVKVTNSDTQSGLLAGGYTYVLVANPAPTLTSISPVTGPIGGGTLVTVNGSGLISGATVKIGTTACAGVAFVSATKLTCTTGASATAGPMNVLVTNPDNQGATLTSAFTYTNAAATIASVSPISGPAAGGTLITIAGTNFLSGLAVNAGGAACLNVNRVSATQLTCNTPPHTLGAVDLVVTNPYAAATTLPSSFTYVNPAPTLTSITPNSGVLTGGQTVTLTGSGFLAGITATIGGVNCTGLTVASPSSLSCTTPAHALGAVDVTVTNSDGKSATLSAGYTYTNPAPTISSISPNSGPDTGGTAVTITGANFATGAVVALGGVTCASPFVSSATQIRCTSAASTTAGAVSVVVTNSDGKSGTLSGGFTYQVSPTYSSIARNIFQPKCVMCHGSALAYRSVDLSTYAKALSTGSIVAGNPNGSSTYTDVVSGSMPKSASPLSSTETKAIYDWIVGGALNN